MILESEDERNAFKFVCKLASNATDIICNDLEPKDYEMFKHLNVPTYDVEEKTEIMTNISADYDVLYWLQNEVKE